MGRPSKLTPEVQEKICNAIRAGNYYEAACAYAGIDYSTFRRWMIKGEKTKKGKYHEFCEAVKKAEYEAEMRLVAMWQKHMPDNWQAIATFLERRFPERWARRLDVKQEVQGQVKIEHDIARKIVEDPEASELAFKLFERVVQNESGSNGLLPDEREMGTS